MLSREHLSIDSTPKGKLIEIMGVRAFRSDEGWILVDHGPTDLWSTIEGLLKQDIAIGRAAMIAEVRISNRWATILYCEGKLTENDLQNAIAEVNSLILFKEILGTSMKIHIIKEGDERLNGYHSGTYDVNGNIV